MNIIKNRIKGTIRFENLGKKGKIKIVKTDDSIVITVTYDENENTIFYDTTTKEFMNMIAKNFVTNFYSFIEEQTSLVDVLSDIMIKNHYFDSM